MLTLTEYHKIAQQFATIPWNPPNRQAEEWDVEGWTVFDFKTSLQLTRGHWFARIAKDNEGCRLYASNLPCRLYPMLFYVVHKIFRTTETLEEKQAENDRSDFSLLPQTVCPHDWVLLQQKMLSFRKQHAGQGTYQELLQDLRWCVKVVPPFRCPKFVSLRFADWRLERGAELLRLCRSRSSFKFPDVEISVVNVPWTLETCSLPVSEWCSLLSMLLGCYLVSESLATKADGSVVFSLARAEAPS